MNTKQSIIILTILTMGFLFSNCTFSMKKEEKELDYQKIWTPIAIKMIKNNLKPLLIDAIVGLYILEKMPILKKNILTRKTTSTDETRKIINNIPKELKDDELFNNLFKPSNLQLFFYQNIFGQDYLSKIIQAEKKEKQHKEDIKEKIEHMRKTLPEKEMIEVIIKGKKIKVPKSQIIK